MIELAALVPHPPIMVSDVGKDDTREVEATRAAMAVLAERLRGIEPETIVLISPHAPMFADAIGIWGDEVLRGDLKQFGSETGVQFDNDLELAEAVCDETEEGEIPAVLLNETHRRRFGIRGGLDHGSVVPLSFLRDAVPRARLVVMGFAGQPYEDLYEFGRGLERAVETLDRRVVLVASGDLSHRLTRESPAGYDPKGREFDEWLVGGLNKGDAEAILRVDPRFAEKAGECGLRSLIILLGALDGRELGIKVLSYEGPFGVGYAVAAFAPGMPDPGRQLTDRLKDYRRQQIGSHRAGESPLVRFAREVVESHARGKSLPPVPEELPVEAGREAGVFVSIKKKGQLRGCIGTIEPTTDSVGDEIRKNAVSAGFHDPRFEPIQANELDDLTYSVDVLGEAEPVKGLADLDPGRYGVIVRSGHRSGLLLPDLEGVDTPEEQVDIARRKAGISSGEPVELSRFEVIRYT